MIMFFVLFGFVCVQGEVKSKLYSHKKSVILLTVDEDTSVTIYQNYTIINLLAAYERYEQECHADSTYKISGCWKVKAVNDTINYLAPSLAVWSERKTWTHKEPTFQGFIGFLRRYKEENGSH